MTLSSPLNVHAMFNDGTDHQTLEITELDEFISPKHHNRRNRNGYRRNPSHYGHGQSTHSRDFRQRTTYSDTAIQTSDSLSLITEEITEAYLSTSLQPSYRISQPTRKLLVLDLNGTLLYRLRPPPRSRSGYQTYSDASPAPSRLTYPRPYLPSFRRYLFHPVTRGWLDVMVWSSAQPHSVRDMLRLCFPREEEEFTEESEVRPEPAGRADDRFFAIWARDTLGLSKADYSRKVQTTKNLEKVWTEVSSQVPRPTEPLPSLHTSGIASDSESNGSPTNLMHSHSPLSTLLLDDSPLKARLQPWNHLCVQEYDEAIWKESTRVIKSSQSQKVERRVSISVSPEIDVAKIEQVSSTETITNTLECSERDNLIGESSMKSKIESSSQVQEIDSSGHIERLSSQSFIISSDSRNSLSPINQRNSSNPTDFFVSPITTSPVSNSGTVPVSDTADSNTLSSLDETLLAAIGILEELKHQSNVCGWLRNRGPWITNDEEVSAAENPPPQIDSITDANTSLKTTLSATPENATLQSSQHSMSYRDVMSLSSEDVQDMPIPGLSLLDSPAQPASNMTLKRPHEDALREDELEQEKTKRLKLTDGFVSVSSSSTMSVTSAQNARSLPNNSEPSSLVDAVLPFHPPPAPRFWFQDKNVFAHWVREGRRALRQLDIAEMHGFEVS